ncbi:HAD family phosphatase [Priestia megaterium]|nr:HAD family phosphatase [Priestia megaterium]
MIIALDMDGTLLNSEGKISNRNRESIIRCQNKGDLVVIATGRAYKDANRQLQHVGLVCPIISLNGAAITLTDQISISNQPLDKKKLTPALEWVRQQRDLYCEIYTNDEVYAGLHNREHLESLKDTLIEESELREIVEKQFQQAVVTYTEDIQKVWLQEDKEIYKVLVFSLNKEILREASSKFSEVSGFAITSSHPNNIEVNHEDATKGQALIKLASHFNIDMKETVVIGDSHNDLPMFEVAGCSVAMENAAPVVKEKSDFITTTNDEDGVAAFLEQMPSKTVLKQEF